jgi:hypothetical protein|tara:strand:- start:35 stop:694 length:660 start_codon:yes stop_codon:yes gene_type:complete
MATRALIGVIQTDAAGNQILTSTYNHYDGYPESLGKGLNAHYDEADEAIKIANKGYISYLNSETGEIEAKNTQAPEKNKLSDDFEEAMYELHNIADEYGADYVHIYAFDDADWISARNATKALINQFESTSIYDQFDNYSSGEENDLADEETIQNMEENYKEKWENFITENQAIDDQWTAYVKSLVNDIRLNGADAYTEYTEDDFKEDFDNYVADKMGM